MFQLDEESSVQIKTVITFETACRGFQLLPAQTKKKNEE